MMVARGMVRSGWSTESAGTVADSSPRNAHSDSVAADVTAWKGVIPLVIGATRRERSTHATPTIATATKGNSFTTVVTICTTLARRIPSALTNVSNHTAASDATPHNRGLP